jgi:allantoin racemase
MAAICIQVINPNTNAGMTDTIATAARMAAAPGPRLWRSLHGKGAVHRRPF